MTDRRTVVLVHAHPDDEALLTGGTMADLAARGHRVVLVTATAGEAGLADRSGVSLGLRRRDELLASALALGVERVEVLGYADSGSGPDVSSGTMDGRTGPPGGVLPRLVDADPAEVAARVAAILREERADVLVGYDAAGGYGHPDHRAVHRVCRLAASLAGTAVLLEATVDRTSLLPVLRVLRGLARVLPLPRIPADDAVFTARRDLTHRVDVRPRLAAKRAALAAHRSQQGGGARTVSLLLALPRPLARRALGTEWFAQVGAAPGRPLADDVLVDVLAPALGRPAAPSRH